VSSVGVSVDVGVAFVVLGELVREVVEVDMVVQVERRGWKKRRSGEEETRERNLLYRHR
jgi:hypothetical protein